MQELDLEKVPAPVADCRLDPEVGALREVEEPDHEFEPDS